MHLVSLLAHLLSRNNNNRSTNNTMDNCTGNKYKNNNKEEEEEDTEINIIIKLRMLSRKLNDKIFNNSN